MAGVAPKGRSACNLGYRKCRHVIRLSRRGGKFRCDGVAVTDNPLAFEPR